MQTKFSDRVLIVRNGSRRLARVTIDLTKTASYARLFTIFALLLYFAMERATTGEHDSLLRIAAVIRRARCRPSLTLTEAAQRSRLSYRYFIRVEHGANMSVLALLRICTALGMRLRIERDETSNATIAPRP